jgi:hypothetical protein
MKLLHCRKDLSVETLPPQVDAGKKAGSDEDKRNFVDDGGNVLASTLEVMRFLIFEHQDILSLLLFFAIRASGSYSLAENEPSNLLE